MCEDCKNRFELNPLRILDCKVPEDRPIIEKAPKVSDFLSENSKARFEKILATFVDTTNKRAQKGILSIISAPEKGNVLYLKK